jgi:ribosomal protein L29
VDAVKTVRREKKTLARVQTLMRARQQEPAAK